MPFVDDALPDKTHDEVKRLIKAYRRDLADIIKPGGRSSRYETSRLLGTFSYVTCSELDHIVLFSLFFKMCTGPVPALMFI